VGVTVAVSNAVEPVGSLLVHATGGTVLANTAVAVVETAGATVNGSQAPVAGP
jgi:hypothetical protein